MIVGPYTTGAFLGLIPMLSIGTLAYFNLKVEPFTKDMYDGTLSDIKERIEKYKYYYWKGLLAMLIIGFVLFILVFGFNYFFVKNPQVLKISVTASLGALFFPVIIYNSVVLPIFIKTSVSAFAMLVVCLCVFSTIFFVEYDVWYASIGFFVGSFIGFLVSHFSTMRSLSEFEYNVFHPHTVVT
jgi:O-antigen/teichoic acid export membrane protein